jgi:hypothetical protein
MNDCVVIRFVVFLGIVSVPSVEANCPSTNGEWMIVDLSSMILDERACRLLKGLCSFNNCTLIGHLLSFRLALIICFHLAIQCFYLQFGFLVGHK